jgi:hypothetical protein
MNSWCYQVARRGLRNTSQWRTVIMLLYMDYSSINSDRLKNVHRTSTLTNLWPQSCIFFSFFFSFFQDTRELVGPVTGNRSQRLSRKTYCFCKSGDQEISNDISLALNIMIILRAPWYFLVSGKSFVSFFDRRWFLSVKTKGVVGVGGNSWCYHARLHALRKWILFIFQIINIDIFSWQRNNWATNVGL